MMETEYFTLKDREWRYKGEGNAHLAISLPKDQLVLRLEKILQNSPIDDNINSPKVNLEVDFIEIVMAKLLGKHFVAPPQIVYLRKEEIENLNKLLQPVRPESRSHKKIGSCAATLWPDLCFLPRNISNPVIPTFAVEIKPKQGVFAPADQGTQQCLFCSKQDLKLKNNSVRERSDYCPLNLFSGDREKMMAALRGLLHNPQNNLTIYKDGKPIFGPEILNTSFEETLSDWLQPVSGSFLDRRMCKILMDVLTRKFDSGIGNIKEELIWQDDGPPLLCRLADSAKHLVFKGNTREKLVLERLNNKGNGIFNLCRKRPIHTDLLKVNSRRQCYWGKQNLPDGCVLQRLLKVQSLGVCGHAAAYELYKQELNEGADNYTYVKNILDAGSSSALTPLQCYLVSAIARDCSIMIAFQRIQDESRKVVLPVVTDPATGTSYFFQIRLMDLDPKPLSCVEKHHKRNYDIAQARKKSSK